MTDEAETRNAAPEQSVGVVDVHHLAVEKIRRQRRHPPSVRQDQAPRLAGKNLPESFAYVDVVLPDSKQRAIARDLTVIGAVPVSADEVSLEITQHIRSLNRNVHAKAKARVLGAPFAFAVVVLKSVAVREISEVGLQAGPGVSTAEGVRDIHEPDRRNGSVADVNLKRRRLIRAA